MGRRRRWFTRLGLAVLAVVVGLFLWWQFGGSKQRRLNAERFAEVRVGMTQAEVEQILGGPPGDYGRHQGGVTRMTAEGYDPRGSVLKYWFDDSTRLEIAFDAQDRVVGTHKRFSWRREPAPPDSQLQAFIRWVRRQCGL
jgi:hypothetical protein